MSRGDSWRSLLGLSARESRGVSLIALLVEAAAFATIPLLPSDQRFAAFVVLSLVILATLISTVYIASRTRSKDHDHPSFQVRVEKLKDQLVEARFLPQLIVAIPRGGLGVAGALARYLGDQEIVPVITLTGLERGFDNPFNRIQFTRSDFGEDTGQAVNVLIVDDICRSGRTLDDAKKYLELSIDRDGFVIRTAAISFYRTHRRAISPSFYVDRPGEPVRDASGDFEDMPD